MSDESRRFEQLVDSGANVFLTGAGGTGKTYLTRRMIARVDDLARRHVPGFGIRLLEPLAAHVACRSIGGG